MEYLLLLAASKGHKAPPLVDVDGTIFIQFGIFLFLLIILNHFVFKPYLAMRKDQHSSIQGAKERAELEEKDADAKLVRYEEHILRARKAAAAGRAERRAEGEAKAQEHLAEARIRAEVKIQQARANIAKTVPAAELALRVRATQLAKAVATKVLGREV
ncbi:MAG: ATP synthase F0 subunit B [Pseudomonadota bacterium]